MDLLFPILIFFLFAAANHPQLDTAAVAVYFVLALIYNMVLRNDRPVPQWILFILLSCCLGTLSGITFDYYHPLALGPVSDWIAIAAATLWVGVVLHIVKGELTQPSYDLSGSMANEPITTSELRQSGLQRATMYILGILVVAASLRSLSQPARGSQKTA